MVPEIGHPVRFFDVRAGQYQVSLEVGPVTVDKKLVTAEAGRTVSVDLDGASLPAGEQKVALKGTLNLPMAWGSQARVSFTPDSFSNSDGFEEAIYMPVSEMSLREGVYEWDTGGVYPGTYSVVIYPFGLTESVDVPETGRQDVVLNVGVPATVNLTLLDAETGNLLTNAEVYWNCSTQRTSGLVGLNRSGSRPE